MSNTLRLLYIICTLGVWLAISAYYYPFLSDDTLISLRYAARLVAGDGLTWNDGYYVEGYSNLSWVLAVAGLHALGVDPIVAVRVLGLMLSGAALTTFLYVGLGRVSGPVVGPTLLIAAGLVHVVPIWAVGGLEQPLVLASLFFATLALLKWWETGFNAIWLWSASLAFAVLVLTRPDAPLFAGLAAFVPLLSQQSWRKRIADWARLLSLPVAAFAGQMLFRVLYYDALVPNTAHAKVAFSWSRVWTGLDYLGLGTIAVILPVLAVGFAIVMNARKIPTPFWVLLSMAMAWGAYIILMGGDIFPGYRHYIPLIALLWVMMIIVVSLPCIQTLEDRVRGRAGLSAVFALLVLGVFVAGQFYVPENHRAKTERWEWECKDLALDLHAAFDDLDPTIAVTVAGCLPYWTEFETVDLLGLNDLELPNRKPEGFGTGYIGHEMGDLDYLLERAPQIVVFNLGTEPAFIYAVQAAQDDRFEAQYCRTEFDYPKSGRRKIFYHRQFVAADTGEYICDMTELRTP